MTERQEFEIIICPPAYPNRLHPFHCRHKPEHQLCASMKFDRASEKIDLRHMICAACGAPLPSTVGGNVLVDLANLLDQFGLHPDLGKRLQYLRNRYARVAHGLFGPDGWNGRHERWARLIDPNLTMRLIPEGTHRDGTVFVRCCYDTEYETSGRAEQMEMFG